MKNTLLIGILLVTLLLVAAPAFCGKAVTADASASAAPLDGALSERWFAYKTDADIVNIAVQEMYANALMDEGAGYGKEMKGAYSAAPVFVESLDTAEYPSYYMVSFMKGGKISVMCIIGVKDGKASMLECYGINPDVKTAVYPAVTESEAKGKAQAKGKVTAMAAQAKAKLVFKFSAECGGPAMPAWDLGAGVKVSQAGDVFSDFTPESKIKNDK